MIIIIIMFVWPSWNTVHTVKVQVQGLRWFLTRFPLKFAENNDVGEIVIWGLWMHQIGIFCRTESVAMTLKIICTYVHYVTLGSRCKMASNHRVTDLEKYPVRISKNKARSDAIVSSWAFVYFLLVISSFSSLVRCVAFQSFSFSLL